MGLIENTSDILPDSWNVITSPTSKFCTLNWVTTLLTEACSETVIIVSATSKGGSSLTSSTITVTVPKADNTGVVLLFAACTTTE